MHQGIGRMQVDVRGVGIMRMSHGRYKELMNDPEGKLTDDEIEQGYVFCCAWGGLLIHKDDLEANVCTCLEESQS
jgi:hypothetical protein